MNNFIYLDNSYCLVLNDCKYNFIDINNITIQQLKSKQEFNFKIDLQELDLEQYKRSLKTLLKLKTKAIKLNLRIGKTIKNQNIVGTILHYDISNNLHNEFIAGINAIFYDSKEERYNYIYDYVCDYLDNFFYGKNYCDFKNNKCGEKKNTDVLIGCCRHFKNKWLIPFSKLVSCEYLGEDKTCTAKCLSCKLFTCDYLKRKGIEFKIKNILLLDTFFNPIQKYFIKYMVFTPKEKILKRLLFLG